MLDSRVVNALVIGDLILDRYLSGSSNSISSEAPVPIFRVKGEEFRLGGACNVANNMVSFGCSVSVLGVIGDDEEGRILKSMMDDKCISSFCFVSNRPTTVKTRIMSSTHQMIRIDREISDSVEPGILDSMMTKVESTIDAFDCVVLSDYLKGVLTPDFCAGLIDLARRKGKIILCDPKGNDYSKYRGATLLTPNKSEASIATGIDVSNDEGLTRALLKLRDTCDLTYSLITLSEDGIGVLDGDRLVKKPVVARRVYDVSGAGDTVIASIAMQLSLGKSIYEALEFANVAAAIVVGKVGSATATLHEISTFFSGARIGIGEKIFLSLDEFDLSVLEHNKVVFTNGCFDILHMGHVKYLQQARLLGDVLVVGVNSDSSVSRLKGRGRPINCAYDRAFVLAGLSSVDFVILFNDDTPINLVQAIRPSVLAKGKDYEFKEVVGAEYAKEVRLIDFVDGRSTTNVVDKIRGLQ